MRFLHRNSVDVISKKKKSFEKEKSESDGDKNQNERVNKPIRKLFFNVSLSDVYIRDQTEIPRIVTDLCELIIERGISVLGIFRGSGDVELVQTLKREYDENGCADFSKITDENVMACAGLLKLYLRELPQPVVPEDLQELMKEVIEEYNHYTKKDLIPFLKEIVKRRLPTPHYNVLKYVSEFASIIASNSEINRMGESNLAIVLSANICQGGRDLKALNLQEVMNYCFCIIFENHGEMFSGFAVDEKPIKKPSAYIEYCYDRLIDRMKKKSLYHFHEKREILHSDEYNCNI